MSALTVYADLIVQHILHSIQTCRAPDEPGRGLQSPSSKNLPIADPVADFDAFARRRKDQRVLADNVAAPHHGESDAARPAGRIEAMALIDRQLAQQSAPRLGHRLAQHARAPRGRIALVSM